MLLGRAVDSMAASDRWQRVSRLSICCLVAHHVEQHDVRSKMDRSVYSWGLSFLVAKCRSVKRLVENSLLLSVICY